MQLNFANMSIHGGVSYYAILIISIYNYILYILFFNYIGKNDFWVMSKGILYWEKQTCFSNGSKRLKKYWGSEIFF